MILPLKQYLNGWFLSRLLKCILDVVYAIHVNSLTEQLTFTLCNAVWINDTQQMSRKQMRVFIIIITL